MTRGRRRVGIWLVLGVVGLIAGIWSAENLLFRDEYEASEDLGVIRFHYEWGKLDAVFVDPNRDGRPDGRFRVLRGTQRSDWKAGVTEGWESSTCDGFLDIYWVRSENGSFEVTVDEGRDGNFADDVTVNTRFLTTDRTDCLDQTSQGR